MRNLVLFLILSLGTLMIPPLAAEPPKKFPEPGVRTPNPPIFSTSSASKDVNFVVLSNQMMITFMERMKNGDFPEAKKIALQMIEGQENIKDTDETEYKSFSSIMEKRLFEILQEREGRKTKVQWLQQPVADGYYFLAMLAFQEGNVGNALENIERAIAWDPVRAAFFSEKGYMMLHKNDRLDLSLCMVPYLKAAELADNPMDFASALCGLGYIFVEKGNLETSLACYQTARKFDPLNPAVSKEIAFIKEIAPKLVEGMDVGKAALILKQDKIPFTIDPIHVQVLMSIAAGISPTKNPKELKAVLKHALSLDPNNLEVQKKLSALGKGE